MNFNALEDYISSTPLIWLIVTLGSFKLGIMIYEKFNKNVILQPILIAYTIIISAIITTDTSYEEYFKGVEIINFFLGPATVALAIPLYKNLAHIKTLFFPIFITLIVGGIFSVTISIVLLWMMDSNSITILSMCTKLITAPIAIITSEKIGGIPSLAVAFVIITGIIGALFCTTIFKFMKIKNDTSKGFALGLISHGIGTAKAIEISEKAAAFSALAMGLNGIFTAIILPLVISILK